MSLQTDAESVQELCRKIIEAEIRRGEITATADHRTIYLDTAKEMPVSLTSQWVQAALAVENTWTGAVKAITSLWPG